MYKKMALELHPDKGGDPEKFQELQEMKAAGPAGPGLGALCILFVESVLKLSLGW